MTRQASDRGHVDATSLRHRRGERITRYFQRFLLAASVGVAMNALVGERGLLEMRRTGRAQEALATSIHQLRRENAALADEARRLREDPAAIEQIARQHLGLLRRGEVVVILKRPPARPPV